MSSGETLDRLLDAGILTPEENATYGLSPKFQDRVDYYSATPTQERATFPDIESALDKSASLRALYDALMEMTPELSESAIVRAITLLAHLDCPVEYAHGTPNPFLAARGDQLHALLELYSVAIVYVWRDDCPPCDIVHDDFEALFDSPPRDIFMVSVYGPAWSTKLNETYDVVGAPTVLFVLNGTVDARLLGAYERATLESEIDTLRALASST